MDVSYSSKNVAVFDLGSCSIKAGFACDTNGDDNDDSLLWPMVNLSSIFGKSTNHDHHYIFGQRALLSNSKHTPNPLIEMKQPIQCGVIVEWLEMEVLFNHLFNNELRIDMEQSQREIPFMFVTEKLLNPKVNREKLTSLLFEYFNVPGLLMCNESLLSLFGHGRIHGSVLHSGYSLSYAASFFDGHLITPHNIQLSSNIGGKRITQQLSRLLFGNQPSNGTNMKHTQQELSDYILRDIKHRICFVSTDFDLCLRKIQLDNITKEYTLPDGQILHIGGPQCQSTEIMFNSGSDTDNIGELVRKSILKSDIRLRRDLYSNIILEGGNCSFNGFRERLEYEIGQSNNGNQCRVITQDRPDLSVWKSGAILADVYRNVNKAWMSSADFYEYGSSYIHRKCF